MKAIVMTTTGGPEVFQIVETPARRPETAQVLIDLKATGLNWSEVVQRKGNWATPLADEFVLGAEGAGIVEEVGNSVSTIRPGDRVAVFDINAYSETEQGTYASQILVDENRVLKIPSHLDFAQAASLPMALLTAYDALVRHSPLPESGNVVVTACTGAVGIAALQLARMKGLRVLGTTRDKNKAKLIRGMGCEAVVAEEPGDLCRQIANCFGDNNVHYVFDSVQGALVESLLGTMADNGTYVIYGGFGGNGFSVPADFRSRQLKVHSYLVLKNLVDPEEMQAVWSEVYPLIEEKLIEIPVAQTFPFLDVGKAHEAMEQHQHFGKLVLTQ